ncbi:MAG: hypothetical protein QM768_21840 [Agriterribacter sp.]
MALNKDILGLALYTKAKELNDKTPDEIGDLEAARKAFWQAVAEEVINHIKVYGQVNTTGTAAAQTGKMT